MGNEASAASPTRGQRLDGLPFTVEHRRLLIGSGMGWALDAMDVGLIAFVVAALTVHWTLAPEQAAWLVAAGFTGMALGAAGGGLLADRFGRRRVFALTLLLFGLASGMSALAGSLVVLIVLRFFIGLGLGAELPVASTLVSEFAPARIRGRMIVLLEAFWALGWLLAALIGFLVVPLGESGWRYAMALGALPAFFALYVRWKLPESVRYLEARGREEEAERIVRRFETAAGRSPPMQVATLPRTPSAETMGARQRLGALWRGPQRRATAMLWLVWFCVNFAYYGAFIWIPSLLLAAGFDLVRSFGYTLVITLAQLPGYAVAAWLIETWGRRRTLALFLTGSAIAALGFGHAAGVTQILAWGMALSFFNLGAWGALYAVTPEAYPTALRATGAGAAAGFGRIASIAAPLLVVPLRELGGTPLLFTLFAGCFVVATLGALRLPERRGQALDE